MLASNALPQQSPDPESAAEMPQLMMALKIEPALLHLDHPALYAGMESICANCGSKGQCRQDLADGAADRHFTDYCGNAATLSLLAERPEFARD